MFSQLVFQVVGSIQDEDADRYATLRGICERLKDIGNSIDRNWGDSISTIELTPADDLNEAIRINPKYASAYLDRGLGYSRKGDLDRALAARRQPRRRTDRIMTDG